MPSADLTQAPVCVLGMGRSGTSLTTRMTGILGVELGSTDTMLPADASDNRHGYWEQAAIRELNDDLLGEFGGTWSRPPLLEEGWHREARLAPLRQRAREIVDQGFADSPRWGWKDPRASLTLPFWRDIVGDMQYVICVRNPVDVAASLARRDPELHPRGETMSLWLRYTGEAVRNTAGERRLLISFEDWFDRPQHQLERLASFLADGGVRPSGWKDDAHDFLDHEARHHDSTLAAPDGGESVPADVRLLYLALRHLSAEESSANIEGGLQVLTDWWVMQHRLRGAQAELEAHREWLSAIQSSASWRGTAFLRRLKRSALARR